MLRVNCEETEKSDKRTNAKNNINRKQVFFSWKKLFVSLLMSLHPWKKTASSPQGNLFNMWSLHCKSFIFLEGWKTYFPFQVQKNYGPHLKVKILEFSELSEKAGEISPERFRQTSLTSQKPTFDSECWLKTHALKTGSPKKRLINTLWP